MWKRILLTTLIAGTLDILAAFLNAYLSSGVLPGRVLQFIASGVFGRKAFSGGTGMYLWGLLFHFIIVLSCVLIFFLVYPSIRFLHGKIILNAFLVGTIAWLVTNLLVIPLSHIPQTHLQLANSIKGWVILIVCIGLPVAFMARGHFKNQVIQ